MINVYDNTFTCFHKLSQLLSAHCGPNASFTLLSSLLAWHIPTTTSSRKLLSFHQEAHASPQQCYLILMPYQAKQASILTRDYIGSEKVAEF